MRKCRYLLWAGLIGGMLFLWPLEAAQNALIVIGTTGSDSITSDLGRTAATIRDALITRGFPADGVEIMQAKSADDRVTTDRIVQSLQQRRKLAAGDEFWLILLGFAGRSDDGAPEFQVSGPRLTAAALKTELDAIPARQFIFIGTSDSGAFVPILLDHRRSVLAATREEGEIDLPRFPDAWATALVAQPTADWKQLAAAAAATTDKFYADNSLAEGEHARLGDPVTGQILEAPFGADAVAAPAPQSGPGGPAPNITAADIKVEIHKPNEEWEDQPATAETKKLIAEARVVPNPGGYSSIILEQRLAYRVGDDRTAEDTTLRRVYIETEDGVTRWGSFILPQDPPSVMTNLVAARIIQPDGSSTVFNPAKVPEAANLSSGMEPSFSMVYLPNARAGCLVEIEYRTRSLLDAGLPDFSQETFVQQDVPVLHSELELQSPQRMNLHAKLRNSTAAAVQTSANGMQTVDWKLENLPAYEELPFDPPAASFVVMLDVSSLASWNDFAAWYRRLARGSDESDPTVQAKATQLAAGATDRIDKIRKAFNFVSALRYVAIEFGVNGFRPRTPAVVLQNRYGDCKDKANLVVALLRDMGIEGRFCLVNRGSTTDVDFPSWQFNHAIAFVPKNPAAGQPDDLWLDTTDSTAPFPTLSPGDANRPALVFNGDSAQFMDVALPEKGVTEVTERWQLQQQADGHWAGTLHTDYAGLAEYDVRSEVRGRSPQQRDYLLQQQLNRKLDDADFSALKLTPADDLSLPMQLDARVETGSVPNPRPGFPVDAYFGTPQRDRPLQINEGQPLHVAQTLDLVYHDAAATDLPVHFDQTVAGLHASASWTRLDDGHTVRRVAELEITQPLVSSTDYAAARGLLRNWLNHLSPP